MSDGLWNDLPWVMWGVFFLLIEVPAILNKREGDTLSERLRHWFSLRDKPVGWRLRRLALAVFFLWLVTHLFLGW